MEEIWPGTMTKDSLSTEMLRKAKWEHKNATKNVDYMYIAVWETTVTQLVRLTIYRFHGGLTFPLTAMAVLSGRKLLTLSM